MLTPEIAQIATAGIALVGTLSGTFGGIMVSNRLTGYRLEQLEQKVDKHNGMIERQYKTEQIVADMKDDIDDLKDAIKDLKDV